MYIFIHWFFLERLFYPVVARECFVEKAFSAPFLTRAFIGRAIFVTGCMEYTIFFFTVVSAPLLVLLLYNIDYILKE